MNLSQFNPFK